MYKALNTVIDDLFAFIIKMPILHRIACFRDDVIFVIYLYQMWAYPVDKTRRNEYGQIGEDESVEKITEREIEERVVDTPNELIEKENLPLQPRSRKPITE
jgi:hypothetical protein